MKNEMVKEVKEESITKLLFKGLLFWIVLIFCIGLFVRGKETKTEVAGMTVNDVEYSVTYDKNNGIQYRTHDDTIVGYLEETWELGLYTITTPIRKLAL